MTDQTLIFFFKFHHPWETENDILWDKEHLILFLHVQCNVVKLLLPILKPECSRAVHSVYKSSNIVRRLFLLQENGAICLPSPVVEMITQEEKNGHKKCNLNMALLLFHIQNN